MPNSIGPKIVLEGEKEYRKAIADCNSSMRVFKSELKAVSAEFDGNANSLEALRVKSEVLNKQQEEQEKKLKLLRGAIENATKEYGENSRQVQRWQTQLNNAQAELIKLNREIDQNEKYMREAETATDKTAKSIDEYGKEVESATQKTSVFGDVLKANLVADIISNGIRRLGNEIAELAVEGIQLASDLEEVQNVVDVTFGENSHIIDRWAESLGKAHGISTLYGKQFVGTMGAMLKSMQLTDDKVVDMSKNLVQLAGDMASFYNIDVEEAFNKIRSGISGETEPLKQLGINMNVANLEAYALSQGINKVYSEMSQAEQATLRYNYLLSVTADAQGDFARNIDSLANQQRILELQRQEMLSKLGNAIMPAVTRAVEELNVRLDNMDDSLENSAEIISKVFVDTFIWFIDHSDEVIAGLKGIGAALITKKAADGVMYAVNAYQMLTTATQTATVAQTAYNTAAQANVIGMVATLVVGLTTALYSYATSAKVAADATNAFNVELPTLSSLEEAKKELELAQAERDALAKQMQDNLEIQAKVLQLKSGYLLRSKEEKEYYKTNKDIGELISKQSDQLIVLDRRINNAKKTIAEFSNEMQKTAEESKDVWFDQTEALSEYVDYVKKAYETTTEALEVRLKRERRELNKAQKAQTKAVREASNEELKILEKAHKEKLEFINKEYLEKIKVVDEKRYNELKAVQDEIDRINNQTEAENRALELREQAKKRAELQERILTAETAEERIKAQEELREFEEDIARKRLLEERNLQIDILKDKKDSINEAYDKQIETLKEEQKAKEEQAKQEYEAERESIQKRLELKLEELAEKQELERDALEETQKSYRKSLSEQKELAIKNAKEISEEELREFKLTNALKYDEVKETQKKMQEYLNNNKLDYSNVIRNINLPMNNTKYNYTSSINVQAPKVDIDYYSIENAFTRALRKVNLDININKRTFGEIVSSEVNSMIRR